METERPILAEEAVICLEKLMDLSEKVFMAKEFRVVRQLVVKLYTREIGSKNVSRAKSRSL